VTDAPAIRAARPDDARALAELRWEFRAGRDPAVEERQAFVDRCAAWMAHELAAANWRAWVAVRDERIIGQVWVHLIHKVPNPIGERDRHVYLSNLFVAVGAQRHAVSAPRLPPRRRRYGVGAEVLTIARTQLAMSCWMFA
jgi:hypothetical protein